MIAMTPRLPVASHLIKYVSQIIEATHPEGDNTSPPVKRYVCWGASPRGAQSIVLAAKAAAMIEGRPHVTADDIRWAAPAALRHRLVLGYEATAEGVGTDAIVDEVLHSVSEPKSEIRGAP
jgi:MoxR-like ATPase